jgi:hypothetical protein
MGSRGHATRDSRLYVEVKPSWQVALNRALEKPQEPGGALHSALGEQGAWRTNR